jgi:outer membrane lipoprotein-sorting protein
MKPGVLTVAMLAATGSVLCFGQVRDDARNLLQRVAETYRNLDSFEWAGITVTTSDSGELTPQPAPFMGEFQRPNGMRIEWPKDTPIRRIEVTDGAAVWLFYPSVHGFCRPDPKLYLNRTPQEAATSLVWGLRYEHLADGLTSARIVGHRELKLGGAVVNCAVVTAVYEPAKSAWTGMLWTAPVTYWIDPKTNIVVQQSCDIRLLIPGRKPRTDTMTTTSLRYRLNPPLSNARFKFRPPEGVIEQPCTAFSGGGGAN